MKEKSILEYKFTTMASIFAYTYTKKFLTKYINVFKVNYTKENRIK